LDRISINKLRIIYDNLKKKLTINKINKFFKYNYLYLSVHFSRDEREFDKANYTLLKDVYYRSSDWKKFLSNKNKLTNGYTKYLNSFKEQKYIPKTSIPLTIIIDVIKFCKQLVDIFGVFLIVFISIILNELKRSKRKLKSFKNKKIFSIYYWEKRTNNSSIYYYPNINKIKNSEVYISSFADSKYFFKGLISSLFKSNFLTPAEILNIQDLILSIFQFIHLYIYDIYLAIFKKEYYFLSVWIGWKKGAEIFYSILTYNSIIKLAKHSYQSEFISWHENQITNRSFALGVTFAKRNYNSTCYLSTFNGTSFTEGSKKQFLPQKDEYEIGFWGDIYYVQDEGSLKEMSSVLKRENLDLNIKVSPESMLRIKALSPNIKNIAHLTRNITIFTHDSYWDLIACLLSIFNKKNKNLSYQRKILDEEKELYIRLHPSLNKDEALKEIKRIKEIPYSYKYNFIENIEESFLTSIKLSQNSFFGSSSYINLAIEIGSNVFSVETSHLYKSPIKMKLINSQKLTKISPW
jgi:hypothetical protein